MVSYPNDHHFSQCTSILHFRRIALPLRMQSSFNWGEAAPLGPFCLELLSPITVLGLEQQKHFLVTYKIRRCKKFLGKRKDVIHKTKMPGTNPLDWSKYIFMSRGNRGLGHNRQKFLQNENNGLHANRLDRFKGTLSTSKTQTSSTVALTYSTVVCSSMASVFGVCLSVLPGDSLCPPRASRSHST